MVTNCKIILDKFNRPHFLWYNNHMLNEKEIEMENSEILKTVHALRLRPSELEALLKRLKQNPFQKIEDVNAWIPESELEEDEN